MRYLNIENNKITYDKIASMYAQQYANDFSDSVYIDFFLQNVKGKEILDAGCGVGQFTSYMASFDKRVLGIDNSKSMIKLAQNAFDNCKFLCQDVLQMNYQNRFDGIVANNLLLHFSHCQSAQAFKRFYDALKDDGVLLVSFLEGHGEGFLKQPVDESLRTYIKFYMYKEIEGLIDEYFLIKKVWTLEKFSSFSMAEKRIFMLLIKKQKNT